METIAIIIVLCLLWSIARTLRRIERGLKTFKIEATIPFMFPTGGGEPISKPQDSATIVPLRRVH